MPYGWVCEACNKDFLPGDLAYSTIVGMVEDTPIEGDSRCHNCFVEDKPVLDG